MSKTGGSQARVGCAEHSLRTPRLWQFVDGWRLEDVFYSIIWRFARKDLAWDYPGVQVQGELPSIVVIIKYALCR